MGTKMWQTINDKVWVFALHSAPQLSFDCNIGVVNAAGTVGAWRETAGLFCPCVGSVVATLVVSQLYLLPARPS